MMMRSLPRTETEEEEKSRALQEYLEKLSGMVKDKNMNVKEMKDFFSSITLDPPPSTAATYDVYQEPPTLSAAPPR